MCQNAFLFVGSLMISILSSARERCLASLELHSPSVAVTCIETSTIVRQRSVIDDGAYEAVEISTNFTRLVSIINVINHDLIENSNEKRAIIDYKLNVPLLYRACCILNIYVPIPILEHNLIFRSISFISLILIYTSILYPLLSYHADHFFGYWWLRHYYIAYQL